MRSCTKNRINDILFIPFFFFFKFFVKLHTVFQRLFFQDFYDLCIFLFRLLFFFLPSTKYCIIEVNMWRWICYKRNDEGEKNKWNNFQWQICRALTNQSIILNKILSLFFFHSFFSFSSAVNSLFSAFFINLIWKNVYLIQCCWWRWKWIFS